MKNLEQLRAAAALEFWRTNPQANQGDDGGKVVQKLPALVINNGLLATAAFAKSKSCIDERTHQYVPSSHEKIMANVLANHVAAVAPGGFALPTGFEPGERTDFDRALRALTTGDSLMLQQVTAEVIAYLG